MIKQQVLIKRKLPKTFNAPLLQLLSLPVDTFSHILDFVSPTDGNELIIMSTTCRLFRYLLFRNERDREDGLLNTSHIVLASGYNSFEYTHVKELHIDVSHQRDFGTISCNTLRLYSTQNTVLNENGDEEAVSIKERLQFVSCNTLILDRRLQSFNCNLSALECLPSKLIVIGSFSMDILVPLIERYGEKCITNTKDKYQKIEIPIEDYDTEEKIIQRITCPIEEILYI